MDFHERDTERAVRTTIDLDGTWEFITDPRGNGRGNRWYETDAHWPERARLVDLPQVWQEIDEYRDYSGTVWYRRTIDVDDDLARDRRAIIKFDAVDYETEVWLNGKHIGENRGGYLPFEMDVTDQLQEGRNILTLAVTDPMDISEIPHGKQGDPWYTRVSGVWQSVRLCFRPQIYVQTAQVTPDLDTNSVVVDVDVELGTDDPQGLSLDVRAYDEGKRIAKRSVRLTDQSEVVLEIEDPNYWTPQTPALYDLEVSLRTAEGNVVDRFKDYFGFRKIESVDGQFLLNGEPIRIRGALDQGYYPQTLYRPATEDIFEREIRIAKDLGFNLIRKHLKPPHPNFVELADRLGILVWEEPANPTRYTERSRNEIKRQIDELIARDYNRPSVVIWSLYNEEWGIGHHDSEETLWTDEAKQMHLADLYRSVQELDPTRLVCDNSGWAHVETDINDYHRYFVSPDGADLWARDLRHIVHHPGDNYAVRKEVAETVPIMISECGTWGISDVSGLRQRYDGDPPWFFHEFFTKALKQPAGIDNRFQETDLEETFEDYTELASAWQEREFTSVKHLIEQMRKREQISGYVLTELSDTEWEFNGVLDYFRNKKSFYEKFEAVNGPLSVIAEPKSHAVWGGESLLVDVTIVNDSRDPVSGTLGRELFDTSDSFSVCVDPHETARYDSAFTIEIPREDNIRSDTLEVFFSESEGTSATSEPITVVPRKQEVPDVTVYAEGTIASRLASAGISVAQELSSTVDIVLVNGISDTIERFAATGGAVVQLPDHNGEITTKGPFEYRSVSRSESWDIVASFLYQNSDLLHDLCGKKWLGWEFEGLYPHTVVTDLDASRDTIHVGYVEGWLANWSSPLVIRPYGDGTIAVCTFRVGDAYGDHPVATILLERLIDRLTS